MVSARKRGRQEMETPAAPDTPSKQQNGPEKGGLVHQIRNMWQFANLAQYLFTFGKAVKIDNDMDIEVYTSRVMLSYSTIANS